MKTTVIKLRPTEEQHAFSSNSLRREKRRLSVFADKFQPKRPNIEKGIRGTTGSRIQNKVFGDEGSSNPSQLHPYRNRESYSTSPPSPRWFDAEQRFQIPSSQENYFSEQEEKERKRCSRIDFWKRDYGYLLKLCESARGNFWRCKVDESAPLMVGCRNYVVTLIFEDGKKWLLKTAQPKYDWSPYGSGSKNLDVEIATTLWLAWETNIPVPRIRLWDIRTTDLNKFGKPWYIMHQARGQTVTNMFQWAKTMNPGRSLVHERHELLKQLAKFQLDFLQHPWDRGGKLRLTDEANFFHADCNPSATKLYVAPQPSNPDGTTDLQEKLSDILSEAKGRLRKATDARTIPEKEINLHEKTLDAIEDALKRLIDARFAQTFCLSHEDYTDSNMLCDSDFKITVIIDWELATLVHLQLAIFPPTTQGNKLFEKIPQYVSEATKSQTKEDAIQIIKRWRNYDLMMSDHRKVFMREIERLDTSTDGDEQTIFTAGEKHISCLYHVAHELMMMWEFLVDYGELLRLNMMARTIILTEMQVIAKRAVQKAEDNAKARKSKD